MSFIYGSAAGANVIFGKNNTGVALAAGAAPLVEYTYTFAPTTSPTVYDSDVGGIYFVGEGANTTDSLFYNSYIQSVNFYVFNPSSNTGTCKAVQMDESGQEVHEFWSKDISTLGTLNKVMSNESSTPSEVKFEQYHSLGLVSTGDIKMGVTLVSGFDGTDTCRITYTNFDGPSWSRTVNSGYDMAFLVVLEK